MPYESDNTKGRVLHIISGLGTGGAERMLSKLLSRSRQSGLEHKVLVLGRLGPTADELEKSDIEVTALHLQARSFNLSSAPRLFRAVREIKPDCVQGWMYHGNIAALVGKTAGEQSVPVVWNIRGGWMHRNTTNYVTAALMRVGSPLSRMADAVIYNSARSKSEHEARGYDGRNSIVLANGFDCTNYAPNAELYHSVRVKLGIPLSAPVIGIIARNDPVKDYGTFFDAVRIAAEQNRDIRWVIVGRGIDRDSPEVTVAGVGPHLDRVSFLGEQRHVELIAPAFDIGTLSSIAEGFPNVLGEAMACGVPCVATDAGDSAFIIGDTGLTVPIRDARALAAGWLDMVSRSAERRADLGRAARARVLENFELGRIVDQYSQLYRGLLARRA